MAARSTKMVNLWSNTITKPTEAMQATMASADVDDDVLGRDPTTFRLEREMAKIMGKKAALFCSIRHYGKPHKCACSL